MVRVYCRCNGGHYFVGEYCPFDGWSSLESKAIAEAARHLADAGITPSVGTLRDACLSAKALARAVVIEFGSEESAFEALAPEAYVVDGQARMLKDMEASFM